jgi:hypothetical protein
MRRLLASAPLLHILRRNFERAALVKQSPQVVAGFQALDMLVHCGERSELQPLSHFLVARAVAVFFDEIGGEIQDLFLPLGQCHEDIVGEQKGKVKRVVGGYAAFGASSRVQHN